MDYSNGDVNLDELVNAEISIGIKTATQKSLIDKINRDFEQKELEKKRLAEEKSDFEYNSFHVSGSRSKREGDQKNQGSIKDGLIYVEETESVPSDIGDRQIEVVEEIKEETIRHQP